MLRHEMPKLVFETHFTYPSARIKESHLAKTEIITIKLATLNQFSLIKIFIIISENS